MLIKSVMAILLFTSLFQDTYGQKSNSMVEEKMENRKINTIIFDLDGVLFTENWTTFLKIVGISDVAKYAMRNWTTPERLCLDALGSISSTESTQPSIPLTHRGKTMPCCIMDWQLGKKSHDQVRKDLNQHIDALDQKKFFKSEEDKELTRRILNISLSPEQAASITKPVTPMINLAKQLKKQGYKLYILSNLAKEHYEILTREHKEITALFDGIVISAHVQMLKPDQAIYRYFLKIHNLVAEQCVFIDNQKDNVAMAQECGLLGIEHKNFNCTKSQLNKLGVEV